MRQQHSDRQLLADGQERCPDGHTCENGSKCVEKYGDEGNYWCDCDESSEAVKGLRCEHLATQYCSFKEVLSKKSFCTNNGTCLAFVADEGAHPGCLCPENYVGSHCQFVKGTEPDDWPASRAIPPAESSHAARGGSSVRPGAIVAIVTVAIVIGLFLAALARNSSGVRKSRDEDFSEESVGGSSITPSFDSVADALDADGAVLEQAKQQGTAPRGESGDIL